MTALRVAMIVFLAASIQAQPLDVPPSAAQLREWIDHGCVNSGKRVGIDYRGALERAIRREPAGLAELFRYTVIGEMDGAAGEAHSAILFGLLQRWGDRRFAQVLRAQKLSIRKAVIDTIPIPPESRRNFPLTYASASSEPSTGRKFYDLTLLQQTRLERRAAAGDRSAAVRLFEYYAIARRDAVQAERWRKRMQELEHR